MNIKSTTRFRAAQFQERDEDPSEFGVRPGVFSRTIGRMKRHQGAGRGEGAICRIKEQNYSEEEIQDQGLI